MRSKTDTHSEEAEKAVRDIRRATRRQFAAEEKIRIVIAGLRGEDSIAELCRKEGINQNLYYRCRRQFCLRYGWKPLEPRGGAHGCKTATNRGPLWRRRALPLASRLLAG